MVNTLNDNKNIIIKIELILSEDEYVANSPIEADEIVSKAKDLGYNFTWRYYEETDITIVKYEG